MDNEAFCHFPQMPVILVIPDVVFSAVVGSIQASYSSSGTIKVTLYVRVPRYLVEAAPSVGHMFNFAKSSPILCFILFYLFNPQMPVILGPHVQILATPLVTESNTRTCDTILMQSHLTRFFVLRGKKAIDSMNMSLRGTRWGQFWLFAAIYLAKWRALVSLLIDRLLIAHCFIAAESAINHSLMHLLGFSTYGRPTVAYDVNAAPLLAVS